MEIILGTAGRIEPHPTMFDNVYTWLIFSSVAASATCAAAEAFWLVRKGWAAPAKALVFALVTNFASGALSVFLFLVLGFAAMLTVGPLGGGTVSGAVDWVFLILFVTTPLAVFTLFKLVLLAILDIRSDRAAWTYSVVAAPLVILASFVVPATVCFSVVSIN
jgi:hypothetical protein